MEQRIGDEPVRNRERVTFSLRIKIIIVFFIISSLVSAFLAVSTYRMLKTNLFKELKSRVHNLTVLGSSVIDPEALKVLIADLSPDVDDAARNAVERSYAYRTVSDQLKGIRDTESSLVRYVYTFVPTGDENIALYLVDADLLEDLEAAEAGEEVDDEEISHFGSELDLSPFPVARRALKTAEAMVEEEFTYDEVFKVNSVSGYAPIYDRDGETFLAMLGIDMVDTDVKSVLAGATRLSLIITVAALVLSFGTSVLFGTLFTRGIVRLDRTVRRFSESDFGVRAEVRSSDEVGRLGASFNQMADTIQHHSATLESLLKAYGRFVPHDFLRFLEKDSILDVRLGDQVQREMTVLFSDIHSFTKLSESMSPEQNFNFLNSYLSRVGPKIRAWNGFIDKYIGDGIMALFPSGPDDALRSAIAMRHELADYNRHRAKSGYVPIQVGIGVHEGNLMLGTVGEHERMDGSVISDAVNLCSRLEALTRLYGGTILVSGRTLKKLKDPKQYSYRYIDRVQVRGRQEIVQLYEVFDGDPEVELAKKVKRKPAFHAALQHYYEQRFDEAKKIFTALTKESPEDMIYLIYLVRCERLMSRGVPSGWKGVELIQAK